MKWSSAVSSAGRLDDAIAETVTRVRRELGDRAPDLAVVFVSPHYADGFDTIPELVRAGLEPRTLVGCSAGGVIGGGHEVENEAGFSLTAACLPDVTILPFHTDRSRAAGRPRRAGAAADRLPGAVLVRRRDVPRICSTSACRAARSSAASRAADASAARTRSSWTTPSIATAWSASRSAATSSSTRSSRRAAGRSASPCSSRAASVTSSTRSTAGARRPCSRTCIGARRRATRSSSGPRSSSASSCASSRSMGRATS